MMRINGMVITQRSGATLQTQHSDLRTLFQLKPPKVARVSEISEATSSSATAPEDRVNFHIGNPVQDARLMAAYLRIVLDIDVQREDLDGENSEAVLQQLEWNESDKPILDFLKQLIKKSCPYSPRGGFARNSPNELVKAFTAWLQHQQEPLSYDLGQTSGKREIVLATGGVEETLRVLYHALSLSIVHRPAQICLWEISSPSDESMFPSLHFMRLPQSESELIERMNEYFLQDKSHPVYLVMGRELGEETRRLLRSLSLDYPLFFIEANNTPNHLSLAREAKLVHRVLRLLTPEIFSQNFNTLSTVFLAGPAELLSVFEAVHFQLKGSPSASEIELLIYLLQSPGTPPPDHKETHITVYPASEGIVLSGLAGRTIPMHAQTFDQRILNVVDLRAGTAERRIGEITGKAERLVDRLETHRLIQASDRFAGMDTKPFVNELIGNIGSSAWQKELTASFLKVFVAHHPEYQLNRCTVVSGSSRTALGLLGFHCNIRDVVIADLSWSYEQCFPETCAVPLTPGFEIDVDAMVHAVQLKIHADPSWKNHGAVVINNPHNATGRIFKESAIRTLIERLLENDVYVIDDLSYQNVAPSADLPLIKTVRQIAQELVRNGRITREQADKVVTVHSVSKTDCLAGARLAVLEIREENLFHKFNEQNSIIARNIGAIALTYLFYRHDPAAVNSYWRLRNKIFLERTNALLDAVDKLPADRNPYHIHILPPTGSMYPLLVIDDLPAGLSLEWLASGLARRGIGMLPLSTFAHTEDGFETGRKTFRLTLGGVDGADVLFKKTRHVLIDLNRLIAEESARYNRKRLPDVPPRYLGTDDAKKNLEQWNTFENALREACRTVKLGRGSEFDSARHITEFRNDYLPPRLELFKQRYRDRLVMTEEYLRKVRADGGAALVQRLERELYKDSLPARDEAFRSRMYDRTVHPTQRYSIQVELCLSSIIADLINHRTISGERVQSAAHELLREYYALNVAINSSEESNELILDLDSLIDGENYAALFGQEDLRTFISFWGDWDGSNRPSGQGHRLVATTLIENVSRLARLLSRLVQAEKGISLDPKLLLEMERVPENNLRFSRLLNDITILTQQLEKRYRGILPFNVKPGKVRNFGMKLHLARDPLTLLWYHNDRLERKMLALRRRRWETMEHYFALNKQMRKQLRTLLPVIQQHLDNRELVVEASLYRDLLQRMVITPRVHQKMITAQDPFVIDTTVHNIHEINELASRYGNPGIILALQVSMCTKAEALIALDRKMRARRENTIRENPDLELPSILLIPLFEDLDSVHGIQAYLGKLWDYAHQSRRVDQETKERFAEFISEIFIAGSDLSQAVGQAAGAAAFRQAKNEIILWLAQHGLTDRVRIKMGSGEPMQRQGGYYAPASGEPAFTRSQSTMKLIAQHLPASARKSAEYATTPLMGIFVGGDLRTFQSTISEHLRYLPAQELIQVLHHIKKSQAIHQSDLLRASESLVESRLQLKERGAQEIERLTLGAKDAVVDQFITILTENFRQILYGRDADVVGMHIASYFIARTMPQLRDRPTVRPSYDSDADRGQRILEKIVKTIPLAHYGSMLRAIAHNQAQTMVLGVNQLTTGLFRALNVFSQMEFKDGNARTLIADRILPQLPVYEILQTLRLYHDVHLTYLKNIEPAFPAGNSAFLALREDNDSLSDFLPLFQQELIRRHGVDVNEFFEDGVFLPELLTALRPDLAVLLQKDIFNTKMEVFLEGTRGPLNAEWNAATERMLGVREQVQFWREKIWNLLEKPVYQQVQSFTELAIALHSLTSGKSLTTIPASARGMKLSADLSQFFRASSADDEMRQFLAASLEYLGSLSEGMVEVPVTIVRAMKDVEQIARIEEQALPADKQQLLRFYVLQIARLTGDNG
ncbi:MAG: aminotransferase class I/II-fold pyridoxal phosphate-dependent enzyme [Ignavibacteriae bacterium]|nr:MAG: aminotransferase class I/II-fold pyridoxal phosphate-dependent enzyme [Ignavibacteriota bacterium]